MNTAEQARYHAALEPWVRKAERERKVIDYVRWTNGHAEVMMHRHEQGRTPSAEEGPLL